MFNNLFVTYQNPENSQKKSISLSETVDNYENYLSPDPIDLGRDFLMHPFKKEDPLNNESLEMEFFKNPFISEDPLNNWHEESTLEEKLVKTARNLIGNKYSWGGSSPSTGFDCSGFIQYVFKQNGIKVPRTAKELSKTGIEISSINKAQPGDLIYTAGSGPTGAHIKMVSKIEDGNIYTIEAKGKKYGVVEELLTNPSAIKSIRRVRKMDTKKEYTQTMYQYLYKALQDNGIDGRTWAPILVAHTSIESNWGNNFSKKHNNFAGIKGKGSGAVYTKEWSPEKGYHTIKDSFKSYASIEDFADDYVKKLKTKFKAFDSTPTEYLANIKKQGYFTDTLEHYSDMMSSRLKTVYQLLHD